MTSGWTEAVSLRIAKAACARAGLSGDGLRLVSFRQNALYLEPANRVTIRVYNPAEDQNRANLMVKVARRLEASDFPAVRVHSSMARQPFEVNGYWVSIWRWVDTVTDATDLYTRFGRLLRRFHDLEALRSLDVPALDPLTRIRGRLERLAVRPEFPAGPLAALRTRLALAQAKQAEFKLSSLGHAVLHGDALTGNSLPIRSDNGTESLLLSDFDSVCQGPREWDLVPTWLAVRRFGRGRGCWAKFLAGYGAHERELTSLDTAGVVKELSMTVVLCLRYGESDAVNREIAARLQDWQTNAFTRRWCTPPAPGSQ